MLLYERGNEYSEFDNLNRSENMDVTNAISTQGYSYEDLANLSTLSGDSRVEQSTLGQEEFFKLLTTQLASQDPMSPMEDTAFISQMASFSALEMQSSLNKNFEDFNSLQGFQGAQNMIGKQVTLLSEGEQIEGIAEGIERDGDTIKVFVDHDGDGTPSGYDINSVRRVDLVTSVDQSAAQD